MQNMWKTDFALFDIVCYDIGGHHISHYLAPNKKPIWLLQAETCHLHLDYFGIYALKCGISWILMTKTGVSMYFYYIYVPVFELLGCYLVPLNLVVSSDWIRQGVGDWLWFGPLDQSNCPDVLHTPFQGASILKLYRWFWPAVSVVACRGLESQR